MSSYRACCCIHSTEITLSVPFQVPLALFISTVVSKVWAAPMSLEQSLTQSVGSPSRFHQPSLVCVDQTIKSSEQMSILISPLDQPSLGHLLAQPSPHFLHVATKHWAPGPCLDFLRRQVIVSTGSHTKGTKQCTDGGTTAHSMNQTVSNRVPSN